MALSSTFAALGMLQPQAIGVYLPVSNYYIVHYQIIIWLVVGHIAPSKVHVNSHTHIKTWLTNLCTISENKNQLKTNIRETIIQQQCTYNNER